MFTVEAFPAAQGDCIWIEYGIPENPKRILIDTGPRGTAKFIESRIKKMPPDARKFELLIMSHIDDDHIAGILDFLENKESFVQFEDVWFNGWHHINESPPDLMGADQGERFSQKILQKKWQWNKAFNKSHICIETSRNTPIALSGGMKLTILSPTLKNLSSLKEKWEDEIIKKGKVPGWGEEEIPADLLGGTINKSKIINWAQMDYDPDPSITNGSSIAVLAEFEGKRALFAADAHYGVLEKAIIELVKPGNNLKLDLFKISHHGSKKNSSCKLMKLINCDRFLISSNGYKHQHPHPETIAKIVCHRDLDKVLYFNYRSEYNKEWDDNRFKSQFKYSTVYNENGFCSISL